MDLKKLYFTDKTAEREGRKLYLARDMKDESKSVFLLVARKGNPAYKAYLQSLLQENQQALKTESPEAEALAQELFKDAAAKHLLVGWSSKGIDFADMVDMPYSYESAKLLMEMDDFYKLVDDYASGMGHYRLEEVVKESKNSASI